MQRSLIRARGLSRTSVSIVILILKATERLQYVRLFPGDEHHSFFLP